MRRGHADRLNKCASGSADTLLNILPGFRLPDIPVSYGSWSGIRHGTAHLTARSFGFISFEPAQVHRLC
ncbi:hypothetical protein GWI33_000050 [Rhynchophorus ferrugineus]|uniref:Uncharacterized protein n=1 Tax=Rhynchophorus ferrugineus TaxID=354439 RepID=A0A834IX28_RHYFE|nr:hypothetical protein GWI33_000050 [Rhynchophorus ferrugineus]